MHRAFGAVFSALVVLFVSACATLPTGQTTDIGPWTSVSGRLLVMEPTRRWQVMLDWRAEGDAGRARLVHAASNSVLELRWQRDDIMLRDNRTPTWRRIRQSELARHGIVISPYALSRFLAGRQPPGFTRKQENVWESRRKDALIRVVWKPAARRLSISDIRHGRRATLLIERTESAARQG